jgi:exodeoxyribonuclease VII small subunit
MSSTRSRRERNVAPSPDSASYEGTFAELQQVVEQLETGNLALDEALALSERGMRLAKACEQLLNSAALRVTRLPAESASPLPEAPADP